MRAQANNGTAYDKQFAPPGTDFSPEEQKQREVDRYVQGRWGEQGLSTQGAAELGIGAQYTAPQNQYSGPEGAGIPQVAVSRYSAAQAVVSAGMTQERATTLSQFPQLTAVLVNAGLMLPTNQEFPEGLPRAAVAAAQTGQSLISPQDVARLLNVTELDAAARKFLATDDPIRQRAIIASMSPLQQAAMMDMISVTGDRLKDFNSDTAMQAVNYVSTVLGYGFDVFWWLNRQAMHASRATIYGAQNDPLIAPQSMNPVTAPLAAAYSAVKYWDNTDIGNFDPGQMDSLRSQYGDLTIDVLSDLAVAEAKQQDEYAWNKNSVNWWFAGDGGVFPTFTPTSSETPLTTVMNKYKDNPEALDVIRRLVYLPAEDPAIVSAMHGVDAASNWNYGQLLLRYVPLDRQGDLQKNLAAGLNVAGTILNDPTLYAGTLIRSARLARYTLFKMAPGADIEKALSVPGVARKFNDAVAFIGRYKRLKDEEKAGTADLGSAEALRAAWARDNKDLENLIDPMMDWAGGRGVQSLDDVKTFIEEGNDLERIFSGRPAREASTVYETMMQSKANMARRDAMMPHYSAIGSLRSRTRQQLALNGLSARYGRKVSREMFGTARTPSEIADVVSSSAAAYGAKYGPVERPMSPVTAPVGAISKRRAGEAPVAGSVAVPFVEELNPGRFKYGVNSLGARWDRATRLLSKKPNGGLISVADGRDADKIYILARAFFPKHVAVVIKDAWLRGTVADRVRLHNGLVVSGGEVSGVRLRYGDAVGSALINDLAAGGSAAFERYSPTIVKRTRPDGGVTYKVFGQDSLENGAFPLSLRGPGEEFVDPADIGRAKTPSPTSEGETYPLYRVDATADGINWDKPQGLYMTPVEDGSLSPHRQYIVDEAGGEGNVQEFRGSIRKSDVFDVTPAKIRFDGLRSVPWRGFESDADAGVSYLINHVDNADEWLRVARNGPSGKDMSPEFEAMLRAFAPDVDWQRYFDNYERLMAVGGISAKRNGYKAIRLVDDKAASLGVPDLTEIVVLDRSAVSETGAAARPSDSSGGATPPPPPSATRGVPTDAVPDPASGEFLVNPSDFNGRQHPLHLWQTSDYVRTPDYTEFERISQRAGFWSAMLGWSETELAKRVTDFWSFYTLVGPRFVARSALEDYTMWLMTDGSWTDLYKGRRAGTRLRAWRDAGVRLPNPEKYEGGQATYGKGPGSRLGFVNRRRKPRTETLRAAEETNNAYGRFILDHLMASERDELDKSRVALATALSEGNDVAARAARKTGREMLFRAFMRSRGIPLTSVNEFQSRILSRLGEDGSILQHLMDDVLEQSAYLNSVRVPSKAEEEMSSLGLAGITMGRTRTNTKTAYTNIFANGTSNSLEDAVGVTNSVFAATWYKQLVGAIKHDGPIGIIGIANLPKYANPRFTQDVIKQVADAIRRDTKWGYKERLAAFTESGVTPEEFAQRYLTDLFNLFSKKDGTLNYDLWRKVAVREKDTTVTERRTIGDQAEPPPTEPSPQEPPLTAAEMRNIPPEWRQVDFYEVLGVGRDASPDVIRRAYRKRLREVHPDVNDDPMASVLTQHVINAHDVLSNPVSRDLYDRATRRLMPTGDGTFVGSARVPDSVRITTEQSRLRVTDEYLDIADLSSMINKDPAKDMSPQWIVGTKEVPIPSPTELGHLDKMWQVLGAQYNRISKEPMFLANVLSESTKLEPYFKQLAAVIGEPAAEARVSKLVVDRATNLTLSYTDNPANRTLLAWKLRNLSRYYRATEDFVRRMMRVTKNYPEGIWKVALTYNAMDESGFVYTDNNGDKYFLYPGQGAALDITAGLMNQVFGFQSPDMQLFEVGGKVKMLMPSTDPAQYVQTLSGPMGVIPLAALATVMPQFDGLESALVGPYASNSNLFEQLVPAGIMRVLRMANPDARQALYASSFKSALQIAVAAGLEPKMNDVGSTDPKQTEEFKAAISNIAEVVLFGKLAFGFFDPASPQLIPADVTQYGRQLGMLSMNSEFRRMIDAQGDDPQAFEKALVQFFSTYGGQAMPYTVSRSGTGEDYTGLLSVAETSSYTDQARAWVKDHQDVVDKFPVASTFLFPRDGKFDIKMYSWYRTEGYKSDKPDAEFYQDLMAAEGKFRYGQTQTYLQGLQAAGQPYVFPDGTRYEVTDDFIKAQLDPIRKSTPFLDVVLSRGQYTSFIDSTERFLNGDASQQGEVRRMLDYYYSPDFTGEVPPAVAGIAEAVATFDYWKQQRDQVTGQRNADKEQRKAFEAALTYNLELVAQKDPNARVFVDQVLMPLATKNLYGPGADGISQVVPAAALAGR